MATKEKKVTKKVAKKIVEKGVLYVTASFNNTLVTMTNEEGAVVSWSSSGNVGFKGTRRATPFAATTAVEKVLKAVKEERGMNEIDVYIKGPGPGRDAALRAVRAANIKINMIADLTPMPHNGPRPKKKRKA